MVVQYFPTISYIKESIEMNQGYVIIKNDFVTNIGRRKDMLDVKLICRS